MTSKYESEYRQFVTRLWGATKDINVGTVGKHQHDHILCRFSFDTSDAEAIESLEGTFALAGTNPFSQLTLAVLYKLYGDTWTTQQKADAKAAILSADHLNNNTENIMLMQRAGGIIAGELFPTDIFTEYSISGATLADQARDDLRRFGRQFYTYDSVEWVSTTYSGVTTSTMALLYQASDDVRTKRLAYAIFQLYVANLVANNWHLHLLPCKRNKASRDFENATAKPRAQAGWVTWQYFGGLQNIISDFGDFTRTAEPFDEGAIAIYPYERVALLTSCAELQPSTILRNVGDDPTVPRLVQQLGGNFSCQYQDAANGYGISISGQNLQISTQPVTADFTHHEKYITEKWVLGHANAKRPDWDKYETQSEFLAIAYRDRNDDIKNVRISHPYFSWNYENADFGALETDDWINGSPFCQKALHTNVLAMVWQIPASDPWAGVAVAGPSNDGYRHSEVPQEIYLFLPDSMSQYSSDGTITIFEDGDVYMALVTTSNIGLAQSTNWPEVTKHKLDGRLHGIFVVMGDADTHTDAAGFKAAVEAMSFTFTNLSASKEIEWSSGADSLKLTASTDYTDLIPTVVKDGVTVNFSAWDTWSSPDINLASRVLTITDGTNTETIDWSGDWPVRSVA